jgi:anti-sigma regulatory factor (Ser/Thr protein kinase)
LISARFHRSFDALDQLFGFTRRFYEQEGVPAEERLVLDFCVEEIFTNFVKYNRGASQDIELALERTGDRVQARLTDFDVEPYDMTRAPEVDISLPLASREPGGLGLQLVRRLVDEVTYDYTNRQSRITVIKRLG